MLDSKTAHLNLDYLALHMNCHPDYRYHQTGTLFEHSSENDWMRTIWHSQVCRTQHQTGSYYLALQHHHICFYYTDGNYLALPSICRTISPPNWHFLLVIIWHSIITINLICIHCTNRNYLAFPSVRRIRTPFTWNFLKDTMYLNMY